MTLHYRQVDVFATAPFQGNGLAVFRDTPALTDAQRQAIARELNQAESIFLSAPGREGSVAARVFTPREELPFAGHPLLGAAGVLHLDEHPAAASRDWSFVLPGGRTVAVRTLRQGPSVRAAMDQGPASFGPPLPPSLTAAVLGALSLDETAIHPTLPLQVVSTGLPYLIVPVRERIGTARIRDPSFGEILAGLGARFAYLLDPDRLEARNWDNDGTNEDPATGSAAGPAGAFLVRHGVRRPEEQFCLRQGLRIGRPSELHVTVRREATDWSVTVEGTVWPVGEGTLSLPPQ